MFSFPQSSLRLAALVVLLLAKICVCAQCYNAEVVFLGGGCFWCMEAIFTRVEGILHVESGYMGGAKAPTYKEVSSGTTGHAEVIRVEFDPNRIPFPDVLDWFWKSHDPTTLNRQGNDVGTQYRSVIFYSNEEQRQQALASKAVQRRKIVTEISQATDFYPAEPYHQSFYDTHRDNTYSKYVIGPKLKNLQLEL